MRNVNRQTSDISKKVKNEMDRLMKKIIVDKAKLGKKTAQKDKPENLNVKKKNIKHTAHMLYFTCILPAAIVKKKLLHMLHFTGIVLTVIIKK